MVLLVQRHFAYFSFVFLFSSLSVAVTLVIISSRVSSPLVTCSNTSNSPGDTLVYGSHIDFEIKEIFLFILKEAENYVQKEIS